MSGNNKAVMVLGIVTLVIIIAAATTFLILSMQNKNSSLEKPFDREMYNLGEFVVNVTNNRGYRFIRTDITILINDKKAIERLGGASAQIRDAIIKIFRKAEQSQVEDPGAYELKCQIKEAINSIIGSSVVEDIYFTEFVIQ